MNTTPTNVHRTLCIAVVVTGASSVATQVVVIRESLSFVHGNELVIGIILATWLALTGLGASLGRVLAPKNDSALMVTLGLVGCGVLPILTVSAAILLKSALFPPGVMLAPSTILAGCFILLLPFCVVSGSLYVLMTRALAPMRQTGIVALVYGLEAVGSLVGGLVFSLFLLDVVSSADSLLILLAANVGVALSLAATTRKKTLVLLFAVLLGSLGVARLAWNVDHIWRTFLFPNQQLLLYRETPYGNLAVTRQEEQQAYFENSTLLASSGDVAMREESVHYAMAQRPRAQNVLVISGGVSGALLEVAKYPTQAIEYVEINPELVRVTRDHARALPPEGLTIHTEDARVFLRTTEKHYDVVLLNLADPTTLQLNRYFSVEFFQRMKRRMSAEGVMCFSVSSSAEYMGEEARQVRSSLYRTAREVFASVTIVPGMRDYFLCSDGPLMLGIAEAVEQASVSTIYVNKYYIDDGLLRQRSQSLMTALDGTAPLNHDFSPISLYWSVRFWVGHFEEGVPSLGILLVVVFIVILWRMNVISLGMFAVGYAGMTAEIILILGLQVVYGYLYSMIGLLIGVFMAGLALGSLQWSRLMPVPTLQWYGKVQVLLGLFAFVIPLVLFLCQRFSLSDGILTGIFFCVTLIGGVLVGMAFGLASMLWQDRVPTVAARLYSIDLAGSSLAALLVTTLLVPLWGMPLACGVAGVVCGGTGVAALLSRKGGRYNER